MPYIDHIKLTMAGSFLNTAGNPVEIFSMSTNWAADNGSLPSEAQLESGMPAVAAAVGAWFSDADLQLTAHVRLDEVKLAHIGTNGKYPTDANAHVASVGVVGHASGPAPYPSEVASAVSLVTGQRGASRRGRFYLPGVIWPLTDYQFQSSYYGPAAGKTHADFLVPGTAGTVAAAMQAMTTGGNSPAPSLLRLVVASNKGYNTPVTEIRVGSVPDVIRRRRNKLAETYANGS